MRLVYNALNNGDTEKVLHLDQLIYVQSLPRETRVVLNKWVHVW